MTDEAPGTLPHPKRIQVYEGSQFAEGDCLACHPDEAGTDSKQRIIRLQIGFLYGQPVNIKLCRKHAALLAKRVVAKLKE